MCLGSAGLDPRELRCAWKKQSAPCIYCDRTSCAAYLPIGCDQFSSRLMYSYFLGLSQRGRIDIVGPIAARGRSLLSPLPCKGPHGARDGGHHANVKRHDLQAAETQSPKLYTLVPQPEALEPELLCPASSSCMALDSPTGRLAAFKPLSRRLSFKPSSRNMPGIYCNTVTWLGKSGFGSATLDMV